MKIEGEQLISGMAEGPYCSTLSSALERGVRNAVAVLDGADIVLLKRARPLLGGLLLSRAHLLSHVVIYAKECRLPLLVVERLPACEEGSVVYFGCKQSDQPQPLTNQAVSVDGKMVRLTASVWELDGVAAAVNSGLEIGLLRTETLAQQEAKQVYELAMQAPFAAIRLADYSGDKGSLSRGESEGRLLKRQLRQLLKLPCERLGILVPTVSCAKQVKEVTDMATSLTTAAGLPRFGVMLETEQAFARIKELISVCDFASIGFNSMLRMGLTQQEIYQILCAAVAQSTRQGVMLSLCGEPDRQMLALALHAGVRRLSLPPAQLLDYVNLISGLTVWSTVPQQG